MFEDFSESPSPADYAKMLINTSPDENKNCSRDRRQNIRFKRQNKRNEQKRKKKKNIKMLMRHYRLLKIFLIIIKMLKNFFSLHQKLIKENQNQNKNLINQFLNGCKCQKIDLIL